MVLLGALAELEDGGLQSALTIQGVELTVTEALHRSLSHTSCHVGQMTYVGKMLKGPEWEYLRIPPGGPVAYNRNPTCEKGPGASA